MLTEFIDNIKNYGITEKTDIEEILYIRFTNILIIIAALGILLYIPYLFLFLPEAGGLILIGTLQFAFYIAALLLNFYQKYFLSRNVLSFNALVFTVIESVISDYYCDIHLFLLIGVIFVFFVFPEKQRRYSYFIAFWFSTTYIAIEIYLSVSNHVPSPPIYMINLKHFIRSVLLIMIFFFAYYSYKTISKFQRELNIKNSDMLTEVNLARNIQQQIMPLKNPADNYYSFYKPMSLLGGDFYDYIFFRDSDKIGIFISDVSGHGVPAALITAMIKTAIFQSGPLKENPSSLLMYINDILIQHSGGNFITAFYGVYNPHDRTILYSNAGHNFPFLIDSSGIHELKGGKSIPLAVIDNRNLTANNKAYFNSETTLVENSKLFLYTDGLLEARSISNSEIFFENHKLYDSFNKYYHLSCGNFVESVYQNLVNFNGSDNFEDDICMICVDIL